MLSYKKIVSGVLFLFIISTLFAQDISKEFLKEKKKKEYKIKEDFFLLKVHRFAGYSALTLGTLNTILGGITLYGYYKKGKVPPDGLRYTHRVLGYTTFTLYSLNTLTGFYNLIKLRNREEGKKKRFIHMLLSLTATSLMGYGAYMAYSARTEPNFNLYYTHRNLMLISVGVTFITIGTIIW